MASEEDRYRHARTAVSVAATAAVAVMSDVATTAGGTFWAAHAVLAWSLLGALIAGLALNEAAPARRSRGRGVRRARTTARRKTAWLAAFVTVGAGLSLMFWLTSVRLPIPDGAEPEAYGCGGAGDPSAIREANTGVDLGDREVGIAEVYYSARCRAVWAQYTIEAHVDLPPTSVTVVVTRSSDGARETAADLGLTDDMNAPGHVMWTPVLRYRPAACYSARVALAIAGRAPISAATACETF